MIYLVGLKLHAARSNKLTHFQILYSAAVIRSFSVPTYAALPAVLLLLLLFIIIITISIILFRTNIAINDIGTDDRHS